MNNKDRGDFIISKAELEKMLSSAFYAGWTQAEAKIKIGAEMGNAAKIYAAHILKIKS